jgi:hypothetical protein
MGQNSQYCLALILRNTMSMGYLLGENNSAEVAAGAAY